MIQDAKEFTKDEVRRLRMERFLLWAIVIALGALLVLILENRLSETLGTMDELREADGHQAERLARIEEQLNK